jgi:hypothetical protein
MTRSEAIRKEVERLIHATPFRRFVIALESGDRVLIEHPENIAFDPKAKKGDGDFYVITGRVRLFSTFAAVSSVALADVEGAAA